MHIYLRGQLIQARGPADSSWNTCCAHVQEVCHSAELLRVLVTNLLMSGEVEGAASSPLLIKWLLLCLGRFCEDSPDVSVTAEATCCSEVI